MKKSRLPSCRKFLPHKKRAFSQKRSYQFVNSCLMASLLFTIILSSCKKFDEPMLAKGILPNLKRLGTTSSVTGDEFTVVVIPDTQFYMTETYGGLRAMFYAQIAWIKANRVAENIVYVAGVGDITGCGDNEPTGLPNSKATQWGIAANPTQGYYALETPLTGLPDGIPYGLTVGNHDQLPITRAFRSATTSFNTYFGRSHFSSRSYWGGAFTEPGGLQKNDNHYDLFTVNSQDYIVFHIEYDDAKIDGSGTYGYPDDLANTVPNWVAAQLAIYSSRKAIIVTHSAVNEFGEFTSQGGRIYSVLKKSPNVFTLFAGHLGGQDATGTTDGEAYRERTYQGRTIRSFLSDYQSRAPGGVHNGGGGLMRLYTFSLNNDLIRVRTINPYTGIDETDSGSQFVKPLFRSQTATRTADFDNNSKSQPAFFFSGGTWKVYGMSDVTWGTLTGDKPVPADYDGDGQTDYAAFRPSNGTWYIKDQMNVVYGTLSGDVPVPGDYQDMATNNSPIDEEDRDSTFTAYQIEKSDGIADIAIWRPSTGQWLIKDQTLPIDLLGQPTDIPVPADYDGDGKLNIAVYRPSTSAWYIRYYPNFGFIFGSVGDIPVPGDYDGDGIVDVAVFRTSNHTWYIQNQSSVNMTAYQTGDIPVPGDYNGGGTTDPALYRPSTGQVFINGQTTISTGVINGKPVNLPYHIRKFFFP